MAKTQPLLFRRGATLSNLGSLILSRVESALGDLGSLPVEERVSVINEIRTRVHAESPFASEPVDCVLWVPCEDVTANDYNPNSVAPPEMQLLERSIEADGYTQPIVAWKDSEGYEVVDGFHRNRVGRESAKIARRVHGYLPLSIINHFKPTRRLNPPVVVDELYPEGYHERDLRLPRDPRRITWRNLCSTRSARGCPSVPSAP